MADAPVPDILREPRDEAESAADDDSERQKPASVPSGQVRVIVRKYSSVVGSGFCHVFYPKCSSIVLARVCVCVCM